MPDAADVAQYQQEQMQEMVGLGRRAQPMDRLVSTGKCFNCDEPLGKLLVFCDSDCESDWQKRRAARRRKW